jgi:hypothetical protein
LRRVVAWYAGGVAGFPLAAGLLAAVCFTIAVFIDGDPNLFFLPLAVALQAVLIWQAGKQWLRQRRSDREADE